MCGIISIKEYEDLAARGGTEYVSYEIVDRFISPRKRKGIIVKDTTIIPANFFGMDEPERKSVNIWAVTSRDGEEYVGFWGDEAVEQAQAYMAEQGFISTTPATPTTDQEPEYLSEIADLDNATEEEEDALLASLR